jgi:hypothetical protein
MALSEEVLRRLAILPVSEDADAETKAAHRVLRATLAMNPDIRQRGDAPHAERSHVEA